MVVIFIIYGVHISIYIVLNKSIAHTYYKPDSDGFTHTEYFCLLKLLWNYTADISATEMQQKGSGDCLLFLQKEISMRRFMVVPSPRGISCERHIREKLAAM